MRVLVTDGMDASAIERLRNDGHEIVEQFYEEDELGTALRDFDAVIIRSATKIREKQILEAKDSKLKLIIRAGVGIDNIDTKAAQEAGIEVKNTPRASSNAVAELTLAHLLSCARNISIAGYTMREEKWEKKAYSKGFELEGKTAGVVGFGRIGQLVGAKLNALGMKVMAYDIYKNPNVRESETLYYAEMDDVLANSDVLCFCVPSGEKPFVDEESLNKMKDGVVIINTSRGSNIDETALLNALNSGKVLAAGLDVYADEKNPNWELVKHPHVSCTPHIGAGTKEAQSRIGLELIDIIENYE